MNIKQAKEEIKRSVRAYMRKDAFGHYKIPEIRQRPILLMGPPGIGKTAIMSQVAAECDLGLVAYTITHHTRQSAIGLPYILNKDYGGKDYKVTEYTMSEIIASVYDHIEKTGHKEGILFIDEINCVSETLAPTMLQFLQGKSFGNHKVPSGWIICAAGNPPEYNKSVRDFDIVTLDRVKRIDIKESFDAWKPYGYDHDIHGSIMSYLEIKKENFYSVELTIDGKRFVTARGWEDLSDMIKAYEELNLPIEEFMIIQYIQHPRIAKDFANYYDLYKKYEHAYDIQKILSGQDCSQMAKQIAEAGFDEKVSVIGLLTSRLNQACIMAHREDQLTEQVYAILLETKDEMTSGQPVHAILDTKLQKILTLLDGGDPALTGNQDTLWVYEMTAKQLEKYISELQGQTLEFNQAFDLVKECFGELVASRARGIDEISHMLQYAFDFLESAFGESQEMVIFLTELNTSQYCIDFIRANGCDTYYKYNKTLLFGEQRQHILSEIDQMNSTMGFTHGGTMDENWYGL